MIQANPQARVVLYNTEKTPHFHVPVSLIMAEIVATQGKYKSTNTKKPNADAVVKGAQPVIFEGVINVFDNNSASSSPTYKTPRVETITSFAAHPAKREQQAFHPKSRGSITGWINFPI